MGRQEAAFAPTMPLNSRGRAQRKALLPVPGVERRSSRWGRRPEA